MRPTVRLVQRERDGVQLLWPQVLRFKPEGHPAPPVTKGTSPRVHWWPSLHHKVSQCPQLPALWQTSAIFQAHRNAELRILMWAQATRDIHTGQFTRSYLLCTFITRSHSCLTPCSVCSLTGHCKGLSLVLLSGNSLLLLNKQIKLKKTNQPKATSAQPNMNSQMHPSPSHGDFW